MDQINQILDQIKEFFVQLNFKEVVINKEVNYVNGNLYCIPRYVRSLGFLVEYANSYEEAQKNWYDDGDVIPLERGEEYILREIKKEIQGSVEE